MQRRQRDQRILQQRRHAAARVREYLRAHRRQSRQRALAALGRSGDRRAAGGVSTDQSVPRLDPFVDGRSGAAGSGGPALGFAPGREELPDDIALAYSKILKAPPKPASFDQRWTVWGAGYGGGNRTSGDPAVVGSHDLSARTAGGAAGFDYHLSRDSVVGVALAGG